MEKRSIDLGRCLVRDGKADCHRCEEICSQRAIASHAVDQEACDGCGLCTAVCPAAAIEAPEDYAEALKKTMALTPQVLMCGKASPRRRALPRLPRPPAALELGDKAPAEPRHLTV